ncbi:hypothetical protein [Helicobacter sp. 16-1353]|nr:hypothetical protein [Helicobacter sp. 16-1353]
MRPNSKVCSKGHRKSGFYDDIVKSVANINIARIFEATKKKG